MPRYKLSPEERAAEKARGKLSYFSAGGVVGHNNSML